MEYDFSQLNDKEFEVLVSDLLSAKLGSRFERFKAGRDGGVDARLLKSDGGEVIIQCKHYLKSGLPKLLSVLRDSERAKIETLDPDRYILATSLSLSRLNKNQIVEALGSVNISVRDVFGQEDLNDLLRQYPDVEKAHSKLWMSSSSLLLGFLNNGIIGRSEAFVERITLRQKFFVETNDFVNAFTKLESFRVLILSGEPGVGKTTVGENLCLRYLADDFEVVDVIGDLSEAEQVFQRGKRQVFFFDDFLGSNYLDAIDGREDSLVVKFIDRIVNDMSKRFILTTRTSILNQGVQRSSRLEVSGVRRNEYLMEVQDLDLLDRAKILYSHLWHSGLEDGFIEELYKNSRYLEIVRHANFNPRIIQFITDCDRFGFPDVGSYWAFIVSNLDNPSSIWSNSLKTQSDDHVRSLVKFTVFSGGEIEEDSLQRAYDSRRLIIQEQPSTHREVDFNSSLEIAGKSFLNRVITRDGDVWIELFNPSIADFVISEYACDLQNLKDCFGFLDTRNSLKALSKMMKEEVISRNHFKAVVEYLVGSSFFVDRSIEYRMGVIDLLDDGLKRSSLRKFLLSELSEEPRCVALKAILLIWLTEADSLPTSDIEWLVECLGGEGLDLEEMKLMSLFMVRHGLEEESKLLEILDENLPAALEDFGNDVSSDFDLSEYAEDINVVGEDSLDWDSIASDLVDELSEKIKGFPFFLSKRYDSLPEKLVEDYDFSELDDQYAQSVFDHDVEGGSSRVASASGNIEAEIHDLFQRH